MPRIKLTQAAVDKLRPPASGRVEYWDTQLAGFGLRVAAPRSGSREGRKTWQAMYRVEGKLVRETIGTLATDPEVEKAREKARTSIKMAKLGVHPIEDRHRRKAREREADEARQRDTLAAAIDRYLDRYGVKYMRVDYFNETKRTFEHDVKPALGSRPIREITRRNVRDLLDKVIDRGSPSHANHVLAYLRAMLNWAVGEDLIESNPCDGVKMPSPKVDRDRALDDSEIMLFWQACDTIGWPYGPLFKLLLLTAQRRDEVAEATWPEFDLDAGVWALPRARAKNDRAHVVHLSPLAVEILRDLPRIGTKNFLFTRTGERPVTGFGHGSERLIAAMTELAGRDVKHFTLHDLRRSAATGMARIGIAHHVLDRVLNHATGQISGVARVYNQFEYLAERKAALDAWSRHVESLVRPSPSNVITLRAEA